MRDVERRTSEMFARCSEFGAAEAASFPATGLGGKLFADLKAVNVELDTHATRQSSGASSAEQGTTTKGAAREALRDDLATISRTARAMAEETPGLDDKFRLPRGRANDQTLLADARAFATDALPLKATFIEYGMPAYFLEDLDEDIADFEAALNAQSTGKRQRVAATAAIDDLIERGMNIARRLDAIVRNTFRDNPAKLAAWLSARHIERSPRRKKDAAPPPPPPPPK